MFDSESILSAEQFDLVRGKIQLILLATTALGIQKSSSISIPNSQEELKKTITQIMALVQNNKELIRRACALLEEMKEQNKPIDSYGIVKDYWENFNLEYGNKVNDQIVLYSEEMQQLSIKSLYNLLFYTGAMGQNRLQKQLNYYSDETKIG